MRTFEEKTLKVAIAAWNRRAPSDEFQRGQMDVVKELRKWANDHAIWTEGPSLLPYLAVKSSKLFEELTVIEARVNGEGGAE